MKHSKIFALLLITVLATQSCKKDNDKDWSKELNGTVWAGEFKYTSGANSDLQPFSIILNSSGTLSWTDLTSTRAGGTWAVDGNKVTLTFPNATTMSANVSENSWSNFSSPTNIGFEVSSLSRGSIPIAASFDNTSWKGTLSRSDGAVENITMKFLPGTNELKIGLTVYPYTYLVEGSGIRITVSGISQIYFNVSNNTTTMKGYHVNGAFRFTWNLTKE